MQDLTTQLTDILGAAFAAAGFDAAHGSVRRSDRPDLCDFQCNGAMAVAKQAGQNPQALAAQIVANLKSDLIAEAAVAGPGFINIKIAPQFLATHATLLAADAQTGLQPVASPQKILVEYAGPNVAKPMHVGHLRSTIIGDAIQRLGKAVGHTIITDIHLGDWGFQMGLLIMAVQDEQPNLPYFNTDFTPADRLPDPCVTMDDLERLYPMAAARAKEDENYRDRARRATKELQDGRAGYKALWDDFWQVSQVGLEREFGSLGIRFDLWKGESSVQYLIPEIVADLAARGISEPDAGAVIIRVARNSDTAEIPPLLLVSSAESAMYATTDVATVVERMRDIKPDHCIYVVDQRQALHFEQLFRACDRAGYARQDQLEHIGFGTMNGTDGKPFKTRAGGVIKLYDLINTCRDKAAARLASANLGAGLDTPAKEKIATQVGLAALKFADLSNYRMTNYVFDFDRFTSFEGKTGPYLQYQGVRIKSLLRKAEVTGGKIMIELPAERALALQLDAFNGAVHAAFAKRAPNMLADHLYTLAQCFSALYAAAPLAAEKDEARRTSRLQLAAATLRQLELGLGMLGIEIPEQM